ncbi:MAG: peptide chain release factor N(5)-glutamine methyltransferase [Bacilli bacterium]|nr:peptide chain release factor N(5)-glutamine methyltransferase [Bacilli bacterium]
MKYKEIIEYANNNHKIQDYEIDAIYFIIEEVNHINRSSLLLKLNDELENEEIIKKYIDKYIYDCIPVQYLLNCAYFYDSKFYVNEDVLIPRFDTEVVVDEAINIIKSEFKNKPIDIVDIGTGSGCIAVTLAKNINYNSIDAIDISKKALDVASLNAKSNNVDINFIQNDLLIGINKLYDVIISNPPYIDKGEYVMEIVDKNEPKEALYSKDNGLYHYKRIIDESINNLKGQGILIFEIPDNKCDDIIKYAKVYYNNIEYKKDYNNQRRVLIIRK